MGDVDAEIRAQQEARGHGFGEVAADDDVYGTDRFAGYEGSIAVGEVEEDDGVEAPTKRATFTAPQHLLNVPTQESEQDPLLAAQRSNRIADREDEYHARRQRVLSPQRADAFALGDKTPDVSVRSYKDVMAEQQVAREREELKRKLKEKEEKEKEAAAAAGGAADGATKKRRRWDQPAPQAAAAAAAEAAKRTRWDDVPTPGPAGPASGSRWDATPTPGREGGGASAGSRWDATPTPGRVVDASKWDATPTPGRAVEASRWDATPTPGRVPDASKWDATPTPGRVTGTATPSRWDAAPTPGRDAAAGSKWDATPTPGRVDGGVAGGSKWDATPTPGTRPPSAAPTHRSTAATRAHATRSRHALTPPRALAPHTLPTRRPPTSLLGVNPRCPLSVPPLAHLSVSPLAHLSLTSRCLLSVSPLGVTSRLAGRGADGSKWDATPTPGRVDGGGSKWDATP